ncbi:TolB-like 6-bladed beta-propeller domain-containing protein [Butyricimonas paravirosa]|uniref:TolB-like 6-bladed beta-propeller domain-containing protein n=1 Tax=Butyricimonas paravirosa TaxID=1472417 RepID=UPI00210C4ACE|nr:TolB-like 6-bladed beta-propeller domain-containing protein [Butyricimonas paravirosa]MCQ4874130.1 TolB-like 6-bladed beta-propeller domain-containing protein [Butyricimonas paravirosa]
MKSYFTLASTLLTGIIMFCSCSTSSKKNIERLTLHPTAVILDSMFTQMPGILILCDHYLVWEDPFRSDYFLHVIDLNTKKEVGVMGEFGRGPKEFITPIPTKSIGNKIFTYDLNLDQQAYYSIDSLLAGKDPFISHPLDPIKNCLDVIQIAENEFISIQPENEHPFQWIHSDSSISFFGESPLKEKVDMDYTTRMGGLYYNPYNKKFIYNTCLFPYFALYEQKDSIFQLKWEKTAPKTSYEIKDGKFHFHDNDDRPLEIVLTKDYIVALQQDKDTEFPTTKRTSGIRDFSTVPTTLLVYDYDFNLKKIINMGMPILRIASKGDSNTLYTVGIDLDFCILRYEL